ncbi:MAG: hypothetical protein CVT93_04985 [Bacteroidetes bacterium HGW-Bacteroidetes-10]|nr:MAG: hypothetical protein CVT93_04985 [Bacteroidetes bacterium HGW-Bacteroidetes-10]
MLAQEEVVVAEAAWNTFDTGSNEFRRVITGLPDGKAKVADYYLTGELLMEGSFSFVHPDDPKKDVPDGDFVWYYKNGTKKRQSAYINGIENGLRTTWYESGNRESEVQIRAGLSDGPRTDYYESGQRRRFSTYSKGVGTGVVIDYYPGGAESSVVHLKEGRPEGRMVEYFENGRVQRITNFIAGKAHPFVLESDSSGQSKGIFFDEFSSAAPEDYWVKNCVEEGPKLTTVKGWGLYAENPAGSRLFVTADIPQDNEHDFSIETEITFVSGSDFVACGIVWGYKDRENYNYFQIEPSGFCRAGSVKNDENKNFFERKQAATIYKVFELNKLKIVKKANEISFFVNGEEIHTAPFEPYSGRGAGFSVGGKKIVVYKNFRFEILQ